jgi:hypothetical protein
MFRNFFTITLLACASLCFSQQKILLIGTLHQTESDRLQEVKPISAIVENFNPKIICVEYLLPTDTLSLKHRFEATYYEERKNLRQALNIDEKKIGFKIKSLQNDLADDWDLQKRIELHQLYYLSFDMGNADYQGHLIMNNLNKDSTKWLRNYSQIAKEMHSNYLRHLTFNTEYSLLVFPIATKLNIPYLDPIDDLSTWVEYEKYYDRLLIPDTNASKMRYRKQADDFTKKVQSLPKDSSMWLFSNSAKVIDELLYVEGYKADGHPDIKMLQFYWTLRNRKMAEHIDKVASKEPGKRVVVFFGASHVGPVREELNKLHKSYEVLTLPDLIKPNKNVPRKD